MRRLATLLVLCVSALVISAPNLPAAISPEQQEKADSIEASIKEAGKLVSKKDYVGARPLVAEAQAGLRQLAQEGPAVKSLVNKLHGRLAPLHRKLTRNGIELPPLEAPGKKPAEPMPGGVSYTNEIVPILVARCNNCHIAQTRGGFSMASYNSLMRGSESGTVFTPGVSQGSRLIDVLESGDMPRNGGPLMAEQIVTIGKWIDQGARFDGTDPDARIMAPVANNPPRPTLSVVPASQSDQSKFSRDIAGVLAESCAGCHGGQQPRAGLRLETFAGVLAGSQDNLIIAPGKPDESFLIRKIKGMAGERMPLGGPPLSDDVIAAFERWVAEGAKYDGMNPTDSVELVANVYKATQMSHDELAGHRAELAAKNWRLGIPDETPDRAETKDFLLLGNVGQDRLAEIGEIAEEQVTKVARMFRAPAGQPLLKGRMTLFVFNKRYDYSEFGQMVERREVPEGFVGHWRYNVVDAYGCVLPPLTEEYSIEGVVAQQLAGAYIESLGSVPGWFSQGSSWAAGARIDAKDPNVRRWDESAPSILSRSMKPDDFLTGALPPGDAAVLNYSFADYLMGNSRGYSGLLSGLRRGAPFDQAFQQAYRGTPSQLTGPWAAKVASGR